MESEDLLVEILYYLPVKSLTRCKCLSKKWNNFISNNSYFRKTYLSRFSGSSPLLLGFFYHRNNLHKFPYQVRFLSTCNQGNKLKSGNYCSFDESLHFIGHQNTIYILSCSNGFILCCLEEYNPMSYYVCNPITKEWIALPKPNMTSDYDFVPTGFICKGNYPCLNLVKYKVVRGLWPNRLNQFSNACSNILTIEMFCSETFEWKVMNMTCDSLFRLELGNPNSVVMEDEGVVHWLAVTETFYRTVVVFDQRKECLQLVALPGEYWGWHGAFDERTECLQLVALPGEDCGWDGFSGSGGRIVYAVLNTERLELDLWELKKKDDLRNEWSLLFRVEKMPTEICPYGCRMRKNFTILGVHPLNPLVLFIAFGKGHKIIMYDVENSKMEFVCYLTTEAWCSGYFFFAYVWPNWPPFFPSSS